MVHDRMGADPAITRQLVPALAAIAIAGLFVGGAITLAPTLAASHTAPEAALPTATLMDPDAAFLASVRKRYPALSTTTDGTLVRIGTEGCAGFTVGRTLADIMADRATATASTRATTEWIIGTGTRDYCPQFVGMLNP